MGSLNRSCALAGVLALGVGLVACAGGGTKKSAGATGVVAEIQARPEPGRVRMATGAWLGYGPWYIAKRKRFFEREGLDDVEIRQYQTDAPISGALLTGQVDVANVASHTALRFAAAGAPITIILHLDDSLQADAMLVPKGVASVRDLKGKRVAYEEATTSDLLLRYSLAQAGMTIADIRKVPSAAADAGTALVKDRVGAAVTYEPYISDAIERDGGIKVLLDASGKPGLVSDCLVVRNDFLAKNPGKVAALVRSWGLAVEELRLDPEESQRTINAAIGYDPGAASYRGVRILSVADNAAELTTQYVDALAEVKAIATDAGIVEGPVDEAALVNADFARAAAR